MSCCSMKMGGTVRTINNNTPDEYGNVNVSTALSAYPVGSIYLTVADMNPAEVFGGGTWAKLGGSFYLKNADTGSAGLTGGSSSVTIAEENLPEHTHGVTVDASEGHTHSLTINSVSDHTHTISMNSAGDHTHQIGAQTDGFVSGGGDTMSYNAGYSSGITTSSAGSHTHTGTAAANGGHGHTGTAATAGAHTHTAVTDVGTGCEGAALTIEQPYFTVFMWQRTA